MKKIMLFLLIGCLALLVSTSIFANSTQIGDGDKDTAAVRDTATLHAYVTPYASVAFDESSIPSVLTFDGTPKQKKSGKIRYSLETNCNVNVDGFGTAFRGVNHPEDVLATWYGCDPWDIYNDPDDPAMIYRLAPDDGITAVWAPEAFDHKWEKDKVKRYAIDFKAKTGDNISSQRAGNYTAQYTVTVWAPQDLN